MTWAETYTQRLLLVATLSSVGSVGIGVGCTSNHSRPAGKPVATASHSVSALASISASVSAVHRKKGAVKAPVFSEDKCTSDAECAPEQTCHPSRCVGLERVGSLPVGTLCTTICADGSLDCGLNRCACEARSDGEKRCAVVPP